jgi:dipeptidyl aminopeptidase/acylaminoacyl peptidase
MGIPIKLAYPPDWYAGKFSQSSNLDPTVDAERQVGLVISNAPGSMPTLSDSEGADGAGPLPENPDLPPTYVTVTIFAIEGAQSTRPDSDLPLSMDAGKVAPGGANIRSLNAQIGGVPLTIQVQGGPKYSEEDLAAAEAILASIRPVEEGSGSVEPAGGTLVYAAYQTGGWALNLVEADGSDDRMLRFDLPGDVFHPTWSPDASRIAFDMDNDIYSVYVDGSEPVRLTDGPGSDYLPAWSPNGKQIAYVHDEDIWVMNADGSESQPIISAPDLDSEPAWSPDGTHLVFQSNRSGNPEIYTMAADGTDLTQITHSPSFDGSPAWSPDGTEIAFASDRDGPGIYLMDSSGSEVRRVARAAQVGPLDPEWSPDGSQLAYTGPPVGEQRGTAIVLMDLSSGKASTVVGAGDLCCIAWRPAVSPSAVSPSEAAEIASAHAAFVAAIDNLDAAKRSGDQAAVGEATVAYNAARDELGRLLQGPAPVVDVNSSVEEQIAGLDRMSAETLLALEGARRDLEQARLGDETQAAQARVEMIENEIRSLDNALADKCGELRPSGDPLPPAC